MKALKNPSTSNPGATKPANINNKALITRVKSPRVMMFIGSVINISAGFTKTLIKAITAATIIALKKLATDIPGTTQAINMITSAKPIHLKNKYILNSLFLFE